MLLRDARPDETDAVCALVEAAFGRAPEADLVADLTEDGDAAISLVAEQDGRLVGHVLLSRMHAPFPAVALAPASVDPSLQAGGVGSALIREAIARARAEGWAAIFVLGSPAYYERFGFDVGLAAGFSSRYASPAFMALALGDTLPALAGELRHAPAFDAVDEHSTRQRAWRNRSGGGQPA
jgi:putative acetyltransferase